jgi:hypothetical protein
MDQNPYVEMTPNQQRVLIDASQAFEGYRQALAVWRRYEGGMAWKTVKGREYLIKVVNRRGGTKSLGPRTPENERIFTEFVQGKVGAKERLKAATAVLKELSGMCRGARINRVPSVVTAILRKLDEFGLFERSLMVIGTHALYGYEASAGVMLSPGLTGTTDVDFLWDARASVNLAFLDEDVAEAGVLAVLRKVDRSFEQSSQGSFRAVNSHGFFVDLVKQSPSPPWKNEKDRLANSDLTPAWLQQMKWLLASEKFQSVVIGADGEPAPMVAPDPQAFAVHKAWLSQQLDRDPLKKRRDMLQAEAAAKIVQEKFPHLRFDQPTLRGFPQEVRNLPSVRGLLREN